MSNKTLEKPKISDIPVIGQEYGMKLMSEEDTPWQIIIHNNNHNSFDEVIEVLVKATECTVEKAAYYAHTVHTCGSCVVYQKDREQCELRAKVIEEIGLETTVQQV